MYETKSAGAARAKKKEKSSPAAQPTPKTPNLHVSQQIADIIMQGVRNAMLPLALPPDDLTKSDGNCLFHALVSQLLRAEVNSQSELKCLDHLAMREKICEFMMTSELPCVKNMRKSWTNFNLGEYNTYWTTMMTGVNLIWGEGPVIQAAAWFLQRDIYIVSEQATIDKPMMPFSGNRHDDKPCSEANLWLGFYTGGHYQTLNLEQSQIDFQTSNLHHQSVQETLKALQAQDTVKARSDKDKRQELNDLPPKQTEKVSKLPSSVDEIRELGDEYNMSMRDTIRGLYGALMLRVGENVFCTKQ